MIELYQELVKLLERGENPGLATLMIRHGSAPAALGAKMLVRNDGTTLGSIGGGCVEAEVWQAAKTAAEKGEPVILSFRLDPKDAAQSGLICGGSVDILVEPAQSRHLPLYRSLAGTLASNSPGMLGTILPVSWTSVRPAAGGSAVARVGAGDKFFLQAGGELFSDLPAAEALRLASSSFDAVTPSGIKVIVAEVGGEERSILIESLSRQATVILFGAGHLSRQVAPLAKRVHFRVVVIDDRAQFANPENFPDADQVIVTDFAQAFGRLAVDKDSFLVILTRGHVYDGLVLEQALLTQPGYIGMIGSRSKISVLYGELRSKGFSEEQLAFVHAPIGLKIGARSPEEIAVSIMAELICLRNKGETGAESLNSASGPSGKGEASSPRRI